MVLKTYVVKFEYEVTTVSHLYEIFYKHDIGTLGYERIKPDFYVFTHGI